MHLGTRKCAVWPRRSGAFASIIVAVKATNAAGWNNTDTKITWTAGGDAALGVVTAAVCGDPTVEEADRRGVRRYTSVRYGDGEG